MNVTELDKILKNGGIVMTVAGSYPLQQLLGVSWIDSDIDCFIHCKTEVDFFKMQVSLMKMIGLEFEPLSYCTYGSSEFIVLGKYRDFQFIAYTKSMLNNFDINICNVSMYISPMGHVSYTVSEEALCDINNKTLTYNNTSVKTRSRVFKYKDRLGFNPVNGNGGGKCLK